MWHCRCAPPLRYPDASSVSLLIVPKFIQGYNGKPDLMTKSVTFTRHANYLEFAININKWAYLAKKGMYPLTQSFPEFILNLGFTIEARKDEEMPGVSACLLFCVWCGESEARTFPTYF